MEDHDDKRGISKLTHGNAGRSAVESGQIAALPGRDSPNGAQV